MHILQPPKICFKSINNKHESTTVDAVAKIELSQSKEVSENIQSNFVYEPVSGMYYDYSTGYYYDAVKFQTKTKCRTSIFFSSTLQHTHFRTYVCIMMGTPAAIINTMRQKRNISYIHAVMFPKALMNYQYVHW